MHHILKRKVQTCTGLSSALQACWDAHRWRREFVTGVMAVCGTSHQPGRCMRQTEAAGGVRMELKNRCHKTGVALEHISQKFYVNKVQMFEKQDRVPWNYKDGGILWKRKICLYKFAKKIRFYQLLLLILEGNGRATQTSVSRIVVRRSRMSIMFEENSANQLPTHQESGDITGLCDYSILFLNISSLRFEKIIKKKWLGWWTNLLQFGECFFFEHTYFVL